MPPQPPSPTIHSPVFNIAPYVPPTKQNKQTYNTAQVAAIRGNDDAINSSKTENKAPPLVPHELFLKFHYIKLIANIQD